MQGIWFASYIGLWIIVTLQAILLLIALRQIGVLHMRVGPPGARMTNA